MKNDDENQGKSNDWMMLDNCKKFIGRKLSQNNQQ
jgi:hypothetical protein